jgi:hypothetical protein
MQLAKPTDAICEIGGGSGMQAFYLRRAGFRDVTIIDLPTVSAAQAYFLHRNGEGILMGDDEDRADRDAIRLFPPRRFHSAKEKRWSLVLNVDSMPEMPLEVAASYLSAFPQKSSRLLSINQEAGAVTQNGRQGRVTDMAKAVKDLLPISRYPFWMREGYTEELYESFTPPA